MWISEDLVTIEPKQAGPTIAHMVTAGDEQMKISGVTQIQCSKKGVLTTFNCLITPDLENSVVLSYRDAFTMGAISEERSY